jgi:hypothetical protein
MYPVEFFQRGADAKSPGDLCVGHGLADGGQLAHQFRKIEMAVRISEHAVSN